MAEIKDGERCPQCGGVKALSGKSHSITQWIEACNCGLLKDEEAAEGLEIINVCAACGKRIMAGRSGSFTQWIFRMDLCSCAVPQPRSQVVPVVDSSSIDPIPLVDQSVDASQSEEMEVEPGKFPLDRYQPISIIGRGSTGIVYYCRDRLLDKIVAVKVLHKEGNQDLVAFQNEARTTSNLNHANIVRVLDFGVTEGGVPFMAMEYVEGISLDDLLRERGTISADQAIELFIKVCDGIAYAHSEAVLHRDIKCSNLLFQNVDTPEIGVRIIDFGVAQGKHGYEGGSKDTMVGSPAYMAPDQALGLAYDERSEVYGIGCTLFEALTGRTPFLGDTSLETLKKHAEEPAPKLSDILPTIEFSDELENIVATCLEKDSARRFQSVAELRSVLAELVKEDEPVPVAESGFPPLRTFISEASVSISGMKRLVTIVLVLALSLGIYLVNRAHHAVESNSIKDFVEPDLPIKHFTEVVSQAVEPHFRDWTSIAGDKTFRSAEGVTDVQLRELAGRQDVDVVIMNGLAGDKVTTRGLSYLVDSPVIALVLANLDIGDDAVPVLKKMKHLKRLDMPGTKVTNSGFSDLLESSHLDYLHVGGPLITDETLKLVSGCKSLKEFEVTGSPAVTASGLARLVDLPSLSKLNLSSIDLTRDGLSVLGQLARLNQLELSKISLSDRDLKFIAQLGLEGLDIGFTPVSDRGLSYLKRMTKLKYLTLKLCQTTDDQLRLIGDMKRLESLSIGSHVLKGSGLAHLKQQNLHLLDLRFCDKLEISFAKQFKKSHPQCVVQLGKQAGAPSDELVGIGESLYESIDRGREARDSFK
ncbi:MAG: serine/threonine protein kinase [Candidatus Obscuribacterales bacterium]|nr:serine/threonine protein kinase [Candidatus Obscuribacterales bacterium]